MTATVWPSWRRPGRALPSPSPLNRRPPPPSPAATLLLSELMASGIPDAASRPDGGEVYVRATLLDVEAPPGEDPSPVSAGVAVEASEEWVTFAGAPLALALPLGSPRPPRVRVELWDTDCAAGGVPLPSIKEFPDEEPAPAASALHSAHVRLPTHSFTRPA